MSLQGGTYRLFSEQELAAQAPSADKGRWIAGLSLAAGIALVVGIGQFALRNRDNDIPQAAAGCVTAPGAGVSREERS